MGIFVVGINPTLFRANHLYVFIPEKMSHLRRDIFIGGTFYVPPIKNVRLFGAVII